jgi:N-acyl homoserine lactone hydrolase
MNDLRLYMFESGILRCKVHNIKMNQGLGEPYAIPVPWFLIQHPRGNVVIDAPLSGVGKVSSQSRLRKCTHRSTTS